MTEKQKIFANEYLVDLNATRAYKAAYPNVKKDSTAATNGGRMLRNAEIAEYIRQRMKDRQKRTEITQDRVLNELAAIAFANVAEHVEIVMEQATYLRDGELQPLWDSEGNPVMIAKLKVLPTSKLTKDQQRAIESIREGANGIEIKYCSKEKALELIGRHLGMWNDKLDVGCKMKLEDLL